LRAKSVTRLGIRREQELFVTPPVNAHEREDTRLRSQKQSVACLADCERLDVVRQDPLEEILGVGS
jgi:hypothetical protein